MESRSLAVIESPSSTFSSSMENATDDMDERLMRASRGKLEAFPVGISWAFASIVFLLMAVSLMLVVVDYAGSIFASDLQTKPVSFSSGR